MCRAAIPLRQRLGFRGQAGGGVLACVVGVCVCVGGRGGGGSILPDELFFFFF